MENGIQKHIVRLFTQIDTIDSYSRVTEGYLTTNYILQTDSGRYFLKQYRGDFTEDTVKNIFAVMDIMFKNDIPTINAIEDVNNKPYFIFDSKIYTLFPFIDDAIQIQDLNEVSIKSLADNLAKIHKLSIDGLPLFVPEEFVKIDLEYFFKTTDEIKSIIKNKNKRDEFDQLALKAMAIKGETLRRYRDEIDEYVFINDHLLHGDYHSKNVFFDTNGDVKYIFDWEKAKTGSRLDELSRSIDYICFDGEYTQKNIDRAKIYIQSYRDNYNFPDKEFIKAFKYHCIKKAHSLWVLRTHYFENSDRVDCFVNNEIALLKSFNSDDGNWVARLLS